MHVAPVSEVTGKMTTVPSRLAASLRSRQQSFVSTMSLLIATGGLVCAPFAQAQQPGAPQPGPQPGPQGAPPGAGPGPSPEAAAALQQLLAPKATPVIRGISVAGNQRIEPETVASYLTLQPGMTAEPA
ncbi:MAG: hypothetical protein AAGL18_07100, partial [Pseudomonadota bacterium]